MHNLFLTVVIIKVKQDCEVFIITMYMHFPVETPHMFQLYSVNIVIPFGSDLPHTSNMVSRASMDRLCYW